MKKLAISCFPSIRIKILLALCTNFKLKCSSVLNNSIIESVAQMAINQAHSRRLVIGQDGREIPRRSPRRNAPNKGTHKKVGYNSHIYDSYIFHFLMEFTKYPEIRRQFPMCLKTEVLFMLNNS